MTAAVVARLARGSVIHELLCENGKYRIRTYFPADDLDRPMTREEAGEWLETVRACGGTVFGRGAR
jgi:hypothetical protein